MGAQSLGRQETASWACRAEGAGDEHLSEYGPGKRGRTGHPGGQDSGGQPSPKLVQGEVLLATEGPCDKPLI